jgi:hypothetical protein
MSASPYCEMGARRNQIYEQLFSFPRLRRRTKIPKCNIQLSELCKFDLTYFNERNQISGNIKYRKYGICK